MRRGILKDWLSRWARPVVAPWRNHVAEVEMADALRVQLPTLHVEPSYVVVDLGANRGRFSRLMAKSGATVIAFEPMALAAKSAERQLADCHKATVFRVGVSDRTGIALLYPHKEARRDPLGYSISASLLKEKPNVDKDSGTLVPVVDFDSIVESLGVIDVLKVDIEGAELLIWPSIKRHASRIHYALFEIHDISTEHRELRREMKAFIAEQNLQDRWSLNWL